MNGFTSKAIHGPRLRRDAHGALRTPLYDSVAFEFANAREAELAFEGKSPAHAYTRITNPTVEEFEQRVKLLSDGLGVLAVSSGMAAIANTIMALGRSGANIVTTKFLFGNTLSLFEHTLRPWGLTPRYVDLTDSQALADAIDADTAAVFLETISNPQLQVADVRKIAAVAGGRDVPLVVDGTVSTPYLFRSKEFGVAVEILSTTKYVSGGATAVGGVIIDNGVFDWRKNAKVAPFVKKSGPFAFISMLRREVYRNLGACLAPHNAWLLTLGLETIGLRIEASCANALTVAKFLAGQPAVKSVNYPGLPTSPYHATAAEQFGARFGGILTFELADKAACFRFIDSLGLVRRATNLNDNKTLIIHPASTIFCEYSPAERAAMGVSDSLIRLAVGIEDAGDLIEDINQGLSQV